MEWKRGRHRQARGGVKGLTHWKSSKGFSLTGVNAVWWWIGVTGETGVGNQIRKWLAS